MTKGKELMQSITFSLSGEYKRFEELVLSGNEQEAYKMLMDKKLQKASTRRKTVQECKEAATW